MFSFLLTCLSPSLVDSTFTRMGASLADFSSANGVWSWSTAFSMAFVLILSTTMQSVKLSYGCAVIYYYCVSSSEPTETEVNELRDVVVRLLFGYSFVLLLIIKLMLFYGFILGFPNSHFFV